jgi:phosphatidylethanolamine/phosphatidyl-N-methylethanolamine N-methyltransferase
MSSKKSFIQQFWREKKMVGAISPSSPFLAEKMLENVDFTSSKVLVEIGPGTGVFTKRILEKMSQECMLLVFELNTDFYTKLVQEIKDERVIFINDSAEKLEFYLSKYSLSNVDAIISSLPLSNIPQRVTLKLLRTFQRSLTITGKFIQFQYSLKQKKELEHVFPVVTISFTPLNIPPAFVYTCGRN